MTWPLDCYYRVFKLIAKINIRAFMEKCFTFLRMFIGLWGQNPSFFSFIYLISSHNASVILLVFGLLTFGGAYMVGRFNIFQGCYCCIEFNFVLVRLFRDVFCMFSCWSYFEYIIDNAAGPDFEHFYSVAIFIPNKVRFF